MPPRPISSSLEGTDLSSRIPYSTTVVASPAAAAETIIAQINTRAQTNDLAVVSGVILNGWAAYTVGTNGTAVQFRIRQTNVSGTIVGNSGALTGSQHGAAILSADDVSGVDTAPPAGGIYVLTMQVTAGSAASTVSAVLLYAIII
jgi:hypothetical protein